MPVPLYMLSNVCRIWRKSAQPSVAFRPRSISRITPTDGRDAPWALSQRSKIAPRTASTVAPGFVAAAIPTTVTSAQRMPLVLGAL